MTAAWLGKHITLARHTSVSHCCHQLTTIVPGDSHDKATFLPLFAATDARILLVCSSCGPSHEWRWGKQQEWVNRWTENKLAMIYIEQSHTQNFLGTQTCIWPWRLQTYFYLCLVQAHTLSEDIVLLLSMLSGRGRKQQPSGLSNGGSQHLCAYVASSVWILCNPEQFGVIVYLKPLQPNYDSNYDIVTRQLK